jgi:hypothetical protein
MATTIPQKIKLRICHNAKCSYKPVVSGRFGRLPQSLDYNYILFSVQRKLLRERPFNLKGGLWFFSKKNILIPNVAEKNFGGGK